MTRAPAARFAEVLLELSAEPRSTEVISQALEALAPRLARGRALCLRLAKVVAGADLGGRPEIDDAALIEQVHAWTRRRWPLASAIRTVASQAAADRGGSARAIERRL